MLNLHQKFNHHGTPACRAQTPVNGHHSHPSLPTQKAQYEAFPSSSDQESGTSPELFLGRLPSMAELPGFTNDDGFVQQFPWYLVLLGDGNASGSYKCFVSLTLILIKRIGQV